MPHIALLLVLFLASAGGSRAGDATDAVPPDMDGGDKPGMMAMPRMAPSLDVEQVVFLRERAEAGDAAMQCLYGLALINGSAGMSDVPAGMEWLRRSAEGGDERGGFEYGRALFVGSAGEKDIVRALEWLTPAAERGNLDAAYCLGIAYLSDEGYPPDAEAGERWMRRAAEAGLAHAQADLGLIYYSGLGGVRQDYAEARRWFILAAKQGNGDSCNKLGVMYRNGYGVTADPERAILWFGMGAGLGDQYAQLNLANSYMNGEWVSRDYVRAARLFEQAAVRGNVTAQYFLGCFFAEGIGVKRDPGRAREWLSHAARGGNDEAGELLERLYEVDDDVPVGGVAEPVRVKAGALLREFSRSPLEQVNKGRAVLLELEDEGLRIIGGDGGDAAFYIVLPGEPGVIHCESASLSAGDVVVGMTLAGVGAGYSGLSGFLRLGNVRIADAEDVGHFPDVDDASVLPSQ